MRRASKFFKEVVAYTHQGTKEEHCSICVHYVDPTTCGIVRGRISPGGWCKKFHKKAKAAPSEGPPGGYLSSP